MGASPPLASNGPGPRPPAGAFPGTASQPPVHPPLTAGPRPPDLGRIRASSSFLPPFHSQQAKVKKKKKHAHLHIPKRHVWKRNTRSSVVRCRGLPWSDHRTGHSGELLEARAALRTVGVPVGA